MPSAPPLEAMPFRLRPFARPDLGHYAALFTDPDVMAAVGPPLPADRAARAAASALRHQADAAGRFRHWVIEQDGTAAGLLGLALRGAAWAGGEAELGILLWPAWQAHGAATLAIQAVRPWAFAVARLDALTCHHAEGHRGAAALMGRVGFERCHPRADAPLPIAWECRRRTPATPHAVAALG